MRRLLLVALCAPSFLTAASPAEARCRTDACWKRVAVKRDINAVERKIARVAPLRCFGERSAKPCWVIAQESRMCSFWLALNGPCPGGRPVADSRTPCDYRACGIYQLLGPEKNAPWPVIIEARSSRRLDRLKASYETLKRKLAHHRIAARLGLSHWGG
jgi:hypothetical protein